MKKLALFLSLVATTLAVAQEASGLRFENVAYPFPVKEFTLKVQGESLQMAYMDLQPEKPNGKTVLLLHGKNFSAIYWERTAKDLSKEGFRVIMPDQVGFGKSSKPTHIQYTFQLLAQNTAQLLDLLKLEKVMVLGHSMGGMLATRFALMYPERTEKLILENPIGLEDWKTMIPYQSVDAWYASELKQTPESMKKYQQDSYYGGKWNAAYEKWLAPFAGWTKNKKYSIIAKSSALTYDMVFTQPVLYEFGNLKMPVLLIIGQRDRTALGKANAPADVKEKLGNYPVLGRETAKKIPNAQLVEIEDTGHLPHIEAYEKFIAPVLAFLKN